MKIVLILLVLCFSLEAAETKLQRQIQQVQSKDVSAAQNAEFFLAFTAYYFNIAIDEYAVGSVMAPIHFKQANATLEAAIYYQKLKAKLDIRLQKLIQEN